MRYEYVEVYNLSAASKCTCGSLRCVIPSETLDRYVRSYLADQAPRDGSWGGTISLDSGVYLFLAPKGKGVPFFGYVPQ